MVNLIIILGVLIPGSVASLLTQSQLCWHRSNECHSTSPTSWRATPQPTHGVLVDLLEHTEDACSRNSSLCLKHVLVAWFQQLFPTARKITRPCRFEAIVRRIAAPIKPSTRGESKLKGAELESYRQKVWAPKLGQLKEETKGNCFNENIIVYITHFFH